MAIADYSIWRAIELAIRLATRANEEVRILARQSPNAKSIIDLVNDEIDKRVTEIIKQTEITVDSRLAKIPAAQNGIGIKKSYVDRAGDLTLIYDDGRAENVGLVAGKDVDMVALAEQIADALERLPKPKDGVDGRDGIGFDDLAIEHDGERTFTLRATAGERTKQCSITVPLPIDRGVWAPGFDEKGDTVTFAGSMFIAQRDTNEKPETGADWRLAVKRGRDGKDGVAVPAKSLKLPLADE